MASTVGVAGGRNLVVVAKGMKMSAPATELGISPYDLGRCHDAVEAVDRRAKPAASVPIVTSLDALGRVIDCVVRCAEMSETGAVRVHVSYYSGVASCDFYRYEWVGRALAFLNGGGCPPPALHWIQGLLFGYDPEAIDRFMRTATCSEPTSTSRPFCTSGTVGTFPLC